MVSRGFRHTHDYLREPKFRRWQVAEGSDLLPWADPYIASLFNADEDEASNTQTTSEAVLFEDEDEENSWRR